MINYHRCSNLNVTSHTVVPALHQITFQTIIHDLAKTGPSCRVKDDVKHCFNKNMETRREEDWLETASENRTLNDQDEGRAECS